MIEDTISGMRFLQQIIGVTDQVSWAAESRIRRHVNLLNILHNFMPYQSHFVNCYTSFFTWIGVILTHLTMRALKMCRQSIGKGAAGVSLVVMNAFCDFNQTLAQHAINAGSRRANASVSMVMRHHVKVVL